MAGIFDTLATAYVVLDADLVVVEANRAYLASVVRTRSEVLGRAIVDLFPPDPAALDADGRNPLVTILAGVRDTGQPVTVPLASYGVRRAESGALTSRWWSTVTSAVPDATGRTRYLVHRVEEVTDYVGDTERGLRDGVLGDQERRLYQRLQDVRAAREARDIAWRRLTRLTTVAQELSSAHTLEELEEVVVQRGLTVLGASGGGLVSRSASGGWRLTSSSPLREGVPGHEAEVGHDSPLPACRAARTGERSLFPTRASAADDPGMASVQERTGQPAWALLPLLAQEGLIGCLAVSWAQEHPFTPDELDLMDAFAAQCAQALRRIESEGAQVVADSSRRRMLQTLQRSLLTSPPALTGLQLSVRYLPVAREAEIGGDFYDAFPTGSGWTVLAVGDITGHDQEAAAAMSQVRNMLRGIAFDGDDDPAHLLTRLDRAVTGLALDTLATVVVAVVEPPHPGRSVRRLRWSNAGHLPPLLRHDDGAVEVLAAEPDLLVGVDPSTSRHAHEVDLQPGDVLVLYTDGLVERRHEDLDAGIAVLRGALAVADRDDADACSADLLTTLDGRTAEDDAALLVLRVHRPPTAAPGDPGADLGQRVLPCDPRSVGDARRLAERCCRAARLDRDVTDTVVLLTSELVTNAVLHGRSDVRITVRATAAGVLVEVADDNDRPPVRQSDDETALSGRGLSLVEGSATRWGVAAREIGKVVWFYLAADPPAG
nr:SpoIIE family protein phosphatase [Kineococcus siccus]